MGNVRPLNQSKYSISKNRFFELYYWCLQYNEWKNELKYLTNTVGVIEITDIITNSNSGDYTQRLSMRRRGLEQNCQIIEQTAIEADLDIYQYIIKAVTEEEVTYQHLKLIMEIPCGKDMYYDRRRKFYWLLDKRKKM